MALKDFYFLFVIALIKMVSWSSSRKLRELVVNVFAFTTYKFSRTKKTLMEKNISLAFDGSLNTNHQQRIVKAAMREFWQHVFSWLPIMEDRALLEEAEIRGIEYLQWALDNKKGIILWESNGLGKRILAKRILHKNGFSIHQVHGAKDLGGFLINESPLTWLTRLLIRPFLNNCEMRFVAKIIYLPSSNSLAFTRTLLNLMEENVIVCISGDGKAGQKLIPLKFLGQTEFFSTGMVNLSKLTGAPILPMFCIEEKGGKTSLIIEHPINVEPGVGKESGLEKSVCQYVGLLEYYIRRHPEQYRNWHLVGTAPDVVP